VVAADDDLDAAGIAIAHDAPVPDAAPYAHDEAAALPPVAVRPA